MNTTFHRILTTLALRLDRNPPSVQAMEVSTTQGQPVRHTLLNLPH